MTTEVEQRTRELADVYMEANPGVPRQVAKRRVRQRAAVQVSMRRMTRAINDITVPAMKRAGETFRQVNKRLAESVGAAAEEDRRR